MENEINCFESVKRLKSGIVDIDVEIKFNTNNLIFGYNGSGKTTIAKIFHEIENTGSCSTEDFEFNFNGTGSPYVRVFYGEEYIRKTIVGDKANLITFSIGENLAGVKADKLKAEEIFAKIKKSLEKLEEKKSSVEKDKDSIFIKSAKKIKDAYKILNYNKADARNDMSSLNDKISSLEKLSPSDREILKAKNLSIYDGRSNKPIISLIENINSTMNINLFSSIKDLCAKEIVKPTEAENVFSEIKKCFENAPSDNYKEFINIGITLEQFIKDKKCPFCYKELGVLFDNFIEYFNKEVDTVRGKLNSYKEEVVQVTQRRLGMVKNMPIPTSFFDEKNEEILTLLQNINTYHDALKIDEDKIVSKISEKKTNPYSIVNLSSEINSDIPEKLNNDLIKLNKIIEQHNKEVFDFEKTKSDSIKFLKAYHLQEIKEEVENFTKKIKLYKNGKGKLNEINEIYRLKIETLNKSLLDFSLPVEEYNKNLKRILGRADITIDFDSTKSGYILKRGDENAEWASLSEGEKTILSVTHFILSLKDEKSPNKIEDCIVVLDDPISSLDTNSTFGLYALLKSSLKDVKQIFILTHHFYFFKLIQKWFKFKKKDKHDTTKLYLLKRNGNCANIEKLPSYLENFESEYQYLLDKISQLKDKTLTYEECISLPNECRRILESLALFLYPFTEKHEDRIKSIREKFISEYQGDKDSLEFHLDYIYRETNVESHLQLFDDSLYFHNNPEEAKTLVLAVIGFIEEVIPEHFQQYNEANS